MGGPGLYTEVEPSAAGVAAIHWFLAAVDVLARLGGTTGVEALDRAEDAHYFDSAVPRAVLRIATSGGPERTPLVLGCTLLQAAVLQSRGVILGPHDPEPGGEPYFTVLNPSCPARCLLDALVRALQSLAALHGTYLFPSSIPSATARRWTSWRSGTSSRPCERRPRRGRRSGWRSWWPSA